MRVLYITGSCLKRNTSANMSHNAYIKGLIDNNISVDVISAEDGWGDLDSKLPFFDQANYYTYPSVSLKNRIKKKVKERLTIRSESNSGLAETAEKDSGSENTDSRLYHLLKSIYNLLQSDDELYPLESFWLKKAKKFSSSKSYDLLISNSSPSASHQLANILITQGKITCNKWIQIWEDPWYLDLYKNKSEIVKQEEYRLLKAADEIYYVSPLTMEYQRQLFPVCANKMRFVPLPFLNYSSSFDNKINAKNRCSKLTFGYFGDYYSKTRNLVPFYNALVSSNYKGMIIGDSDLNLESTNEVSVSPRITLDILQKKQEETDVLVHLSNLNGGQIPGKIYHYSATKKPILFILDGTNEEIEQLRNYFGRFNRYLFCKNDEDSILKTMQLIEEGNNSWNAVMDFSPKIVVRNILNNS